MATKERNQNPVCNDTVILRLYQFNENAPADVNEVQKVEIYVHDHTVEGGRRLVQTITDIARSDVGQYSVVVDLTSPTYTIGQYCDVWTISYEADECPGTRTFEFEINADKWYGNSDQFIWDFYFAFRPTRFRKNERKYIVVEVTPNVPHLSDLERYYQTLQTYPDLFITIQMRCVECMPAEEDLQVVVDRARVSLTSSRLGQYFLDTTELACGIYDVWFDLEVGGNTYISPKNQIQIF
jgi:hypothetical protein